MKKTYNTPKTEVIKIESESLLAGSIGIEDGHADGGFIELNLDDEEEYQRN